MLTSPLTCSLKAQITSLVIPHAEKLVMASGGRRTALGWSGMVQGWSRTAPAPRPRSHPATVEASGDADVSVAHLGIAGVGGRAPDAGWGQGDEGLLKMWGWWTNPDSTNGTGSIKGSATAPSEPGPFAKGWGAGPWGHPRGHAGPCSQLHSQTPAQQLQDLPQPPNDTFSISTSER